MRPVRKFFCIWALCCAGGAQADLGWDGTVAVPAVAAGPGRWLTCPRGAGFDLDKAFMVDTRRCITPGFFYNEPVGTPQELALPDLLRIHFTPPAGYQVEAVGPIPVTQGNSGRIDQRTIWIAYRLRKGR